MVDQIHVIIDYTLHTILQLETAGGISGVKINERKYTGTKRFTGQAFVSCN